MKLSIITINYNNAEGLERTLNSVLAQTYDGIEHIIVDGGSSDESVKVIQDYVTKVKSEEVRGKSVGWSSEKDKGIYDAMNKGVKCASGDYVWILNSGDVVAAPDVVERMMKILNDRMSRDKSLNDGCDHTLNDGGIDILLGNKIHVYSNDKKKNDPLPVKRYSDMTPRPMDVSMLTFYIGTVPQDAAFVRRELFEKYGYFDDKLKIVSDWKLYLNMIALGDVKPMYVNVDVVLFDMTGISNSNMERRNMEKRAYLEEILPSSVLQDYDAYAFPIEQYKRLKKYHLWPIVYFMERVLFKFNKWGILK